jgi:transposase-like protein
MNLMDVYERFPTEQHCIDYLEKRRWPKYATCPKCQCARLGKYESMGKTGKTRKVFECLDCGYQFTVTTGTIFHDSHLDLRKWFCAIALIVDAKKGISANQVSRHIKVTYKTAWHLCHRIREGFRDGSLGKLTGVVEVDETYIGGKAKLGERRLAPKTPVMGAVQRGGELRLKKMRKGEGVSGEDAHSFIRENIAGEGLQMICTDESKIYPNTIRAAGWRPLHQTVAHRKLEFIRGVVYTNTIEGAFGLFKRGLVGTYHQLSHKHLDRYLQEFEYRYNNRKAPNLFGKVTNNALEAQPLPYKKLIGK